MEVLKTWHASYEAGAPRSSSMLALRLAAQVLVVVCVVGGPLGISALFASSSSCTATTTFIQPAKPSCFEASSRRRVVGHSFIRYSASSSMSGEGEAITVVHDPDEATLSKLGVRQWPTWGCDVSCFPWSYGEAETCYILEGKVTVTPTNGKGEAVTVGKGDLVTFAEGLSCTWDVHAPIRKHYRFS